MRASIVSLLVVGAAAAFVALLGFAVGIFGDQRSLDSMVERHDFPAAPESSLELPVLGSARRASIRDYRGRLVVLNFYSSWCQACHGEASLLAREQHALVRRDATVIGVTYQDAGSDMKTFDRQFHVTYPVLQDADGAIASAYGVIGVPETFVISPSGRVIAIRRWPVTNWWFVHVLNTVLPKKMRRRD